MNETKRLTCGLLLAGAMVASAALSAGAQNVYTVGVAFGPPPAALHERMPAPPQPGMKWRAGYWHWDGNRYVWVHGDYARPPRATAIWIPEHYVRGENNEWRLDEGHWAG